MAEYKYYTDSEKYDPEKKYKVVDAYSYRGSVGINPGCSDQDIYVNEIATVSQMRKWGGDLSVEVTCRSEEWSTSPRGGRLAKHLYLTVEPAEE